jgi:hypothetical protein
LQLAVTSDKYELYDGADENQVLAEYKQHRSSWAINPFSWKQKDIKLNPFNQSCVGILSSESYEIHLNIISKFHILFSNFENLVLDMLPAPRCWIFFIS